MTLRRHRSCVRRSPAPRRPMRRGFNLVELLIALAISAALLTATMDATPVAKLDLGTTPGLSVAAVRDRKGRKRWAIGALVLAVVVVFVVVGGGGSGDFGCGADVFTLTPASCHESLRTGGTGQCGLEQLSFRRTAIKCRGLARRQAAKHLVNRRPTARGKFIANANVLQQFAQCRC